MKKKLLIIFTLLFFFPFVVDAYELKVDWQKSWGGNNWESFYDVLQTKDGGYIAYGISGSTDIEGLPNKGGTDVIIVKYDKDGNIKWQKSWGGNNWESFNGIFQTEDGGYILCGESSSTDIEGLLIKGESDAIIVKYDKDGNLLWQKSWGGNDWESFYDVLQTKDGGYIVYGSSDSTDIEGLPNKGDSDVIIVKYDKDGNLLWQKSWGGNFSDGFESAFQTKDGGYIVYGSSESTDIEGLLIKGESDAIIVKYDKDGNLLWQKSWGGNSSDSFNNVFQTEDGGYIVCGSSDSTDIEGLPNKGYDDVIIVKYDKDGNIKWQKSWGGNFSDGLKGVFQTENSGFIVFGFSGSTDIEGLPKKGDYDAIIVKYDKDGNLLWQKRWGGNSSDSFNNVFQTEDGGYIVYGASSSTDIEGLLIKGGSDAIIVKYDKDGNLLWQKSWGGNYSDSFNNVFQTEDGGYIVYGRSDSTDIEGLPNKGYLDVIILKYSTVYELENVTHENGTFIVEQQGKYGIISPKPNKGYEVDKIIIKDKDENVLDVELTKLEDGTYSFVLYDDVTVEVLFKEELVNPKTGVAGMLDIMFATLLIIVGSFFVIRNYKDEYEN